MIMTTDSFPWEVTGSHWLATWFNKRQSRF